MENEMRSIKGERDLMYYEENLKNMRGFEKNSQRSDSVIKKGTLEHHLTSHKGKLVKIELVGNGYKKFKIGQLLDVGEDYVVIKVGNAPVSTVVPISNIECITFVHNNDKRRIGNC